ncbi:hypothetical protein MIMGU_mgv11b018117mg [Erythranthe guttata]|uniref:non-specific serine/threonine protein kinase n=1 Tax=Erythranthe guttata TaxID=4155 RepID=A0A022RTF7_ERYGU|nr:hypothetical protein MIMGU_mgv11b018117mg [Erythranthe guttata]
MGKTSCCILACIVILLLQMSYYCLAIKYSTTLETDKSALLALKSHITFDPASILSQNWTNSSSVCSWIGVTCGLRHNRVTAVNISYMGLSGTIPPQLGNLSFLVSLDFKFNLLSGVLPQQLSFLHRLKFMSFRANTLSGEIPPWLGLLTKLEFLSLGNNSFTGIYLSENKLSGEIPSNLSKCLQLRVVSLSYNSFSGQIPKEIGELKFLQILYLGGNSLNGVIPSEIGNLQNLAQLAIEQNQISGTVPISIFNISSLQVLALNDNQLSGNLPKDIGNLTKLKHLGFSQNNLTGGIPREIGNIYQLDTLKLDVNSFTGFIPLELFNMSNIRILDLLANSLSGSLPTNLDHGLPALEELYLAKNELSGSIPDSITNCSKLRILELGDNNFTGFVPHFFGNLRMLEYLSIYNNNLRIGSTSSELSFITSLSNCRSLIRLTIANNPLDGIIPASIGNLSISLQELMAFNCQIKGIIPPEIGNLSNLVKFSFNENELFGNIPSTVNHLHKLQGLYLSNNSMRGSIPEGLCDLHNLDSLFLSRNKFSGQIPECLENITSLRYLYLDSNMLNLSIPSSLWRLTDLLHLDLSSNFLSGIIPLEIGNLVSTTLMNLSMNQLSESIPRTLGNLISLKNLSLAHNRLEGSIPESMGSMISLEAVDLSDNNLSGSIPKSLETLKYLIYFNVSFNGLRGEIPNGGHFTNLTMESFKGNEALCGVPRFNVPLCRNASNHGAMMKRAHFALFIISGIVAFISLVSLAFIILIRYRRKDKAANGNDGLVPTVPERISYYELLQATEQFSETNLLGMGSFGSVYKAILRDGKIFAVKVFHSLSEAASKSFEIECAVLRNIRHRNLTKVISSCSNEDFKALVLEYMPNGNLDQWLYSHNYYLDLMQRLNIMIDVACALEYLHHGHSTLIVHCDLKPSNVLLDGDMVAHVSDFGIAKLMGEGESTVHTSTLATMGYIAPEYGLEGLVSTRCDVYSYGVMVIETFTRKRPSDEMFGGDLTLKSWVQSSLNNESSTEVIDANLLNTENEQGFEKNVQLAHHYSLIGFRGYCFSAFDAFIVSVVYDTKMTMASGGEYLYMAVEMGRVIPALTAGLRR